MIKWIRNWFERRRRARDWRVVRQWRSHCVWDHEKNEHAGTILIIGWENGLGQRDIEMMKGPLPPDRWGNPKRSASGHWADALAWKYEVRAPNPNGARLRIVK